MCSDITVSVLKQFFAMRRTFPCNAAWTSDSEFLLLECSFVKPWNLELGSFFVISRGAILCIDLIMQTKELGTCPVRQIVGYSFFYMRISNVYIVMVVSNNANVACAFKFVVEAVTLFKSYFGGAFDEDAIRNNFLLIYELLDARPVPNATLQVTGAVGRRREGPVYKKNEVFFDIVGSVNLLMSSKGKILMKCFLSGMPDSKLGLNDKIGLEKESQLKSHPTKSGKTIELDDVTFHQCVNLTTFNSEKTASFVPT